MGPTHEYFELFKVGTASKRLERAGPGNADYYARQLRGWLQEAILKPYHVVGSGRTAAQMLSLEEVCKARVISKIAGLGMTTEMLRSVANLFETDHQSKVIDRRNVTRALSAIRNPGVITPQFFVLHLPINAGTQLTGGLTDDASVACELAADANFGGHLLLNLTPLLHPVLVNPYGHDEDIPADDTLQLRAI